MPYTKVQDFALHLKDGRLMGSICRNCGFYTFPPRADCPECLSDNFALKEISGKGTLYTYTRIDAAPTGFQEDVPYTIAVVELAEGGRALGRVGETIPTIGIRIGMAVQVVPRMFEDCEDIRVHYTIEQPGTTWKKGPT